MAKIVEFDNRSIFADVAEEVAVLRSPAAPGSSVSLVLDNNNRLVDNDFVVIGKVGTGRAELTDINDTVTAGTGIRVTTVRFPHNVGTKIYKLAYDQIELSHAATVGGAKTEVDTIPIDVDNIFTAFVDPDHTTGYAFFRLYNSTLDTYSDYSEAFNYAGVALSTKAKIRELVEFYFEKPVEDSIFDTLLNAQEDEIMSIFPWRFREKTGTFTTTADQADYNLEDEGLTDVGIIMSLKYDNKPIPFISQNDNDNLNVLTPISSSFFGAYMWEETLTFTPAPDDEKEVQVRYYKNSLGLEGETSTTSVHLPQVLAFGVLQELWAIPDPKKSAYFEKRKAQCIPLMRERNKKQSATMRTLGRSEDRARLSRTGSFSYPVIDLP